MQEFFPKVNYLFAITLLFDLSRYVISGKPRDPARYAQAREVLCWFSYLLCFSYVLQRHSAAPCIEVHCSMKRAQVEKFLRGSSFGMATGSSLAAKTTVTASLSSTYTWMKPVANGQGVASNAHHNQRNLSEIFFKSVKWTKPFIRYVYQVSHRNLWILTENIQIGDIEIGVRG